MRQAEERIAVRQGKHGATAIGVALAALLGIVMFRTMPRDPFTTLRSLPQRPAEARLTAFDYAPFKHPRSANSENLPASAATGALAAAVKRDRTPVNLHRYALALAALGKMPVAVDLLREASTRDSNDATILADLAAVQLATGADADAAENAAIALQRDPAEAAAAFNWALALESLSNRPAALKAWEHYKSLEGSGPWVTEAEAHIARLRQARGTWESEKTQLADGVPEGTIRRIVRAYPQRVRSWVADELLPRWIENRRPGDLSLLETIAAVRTESGDLFLRDVAADARACHSDFVAGVRLFAEGRAAARRRAMDVAGTKFVESARLLDRDGSPFALTASIFAASNQSYHGNASAAYATLSMIDGRLQRYPCIGAEAEWVRGLLQGRAGEQNEALQSFRAGLALATRSGEIENEVALTALIATQLDQLADPAEGDRYRAEALRRIDQIGAAAQRTYVAISETALVQIQRKRPHLALAFIDTQENLAIAAHDPLLLAESASARALALRDIGRRDSAIIAIAAARGHARNITTEALRERTLADIEYTDAIVRKTDAPAAALTLLTSAIQRWERNGWRYHIASAHITVGDIRLSAGDRRGAEGEYRAGIEAMERQRTAVDETALRIAFFERADTLFERLIELLLDEKRFNDALVVADSKRSRTLRDAVSRNGAAPPPEVAAIRAGVPDFAALLELELLPRGAFGWLVDRDSVVPFQSKSHGGDIANAVVRYREAIERGDDETTRREGKWLFEQLIAPIAARIGAGRTLMIVPDRELFALPFASLIDNNGTYFVASNPITVVPAASLINDAAPTARRLRVLAVAQPEPGTLPRLEHARDETEQLSAFYDQASIYIGTNLTPRQFLRRGAEADVVSFAGHGTTHALLFESRGGQAPERLSADEIASSRFARHPVVVLAACNSGRGTVRATEGVDSLATAFLRAGARSVAATLWDVDDEASEHLFLAFHRNMSRGETPADALRHAQLAMINSRIIADRRPASWAGVSLFGSE